MMDGMHYALIEFPSATDLIVHKLRHSSGLGILLGEAWAYKGGPLVARHVCYSLE